jgi:protein-S-isoprenylcysteine O-methyltransferase Ste14
MRLKAFSTDLVYALDVLYATMGYILSLRVFDSHVRSAEPTLFGWVIALECYDPFWRAMSSKLYLHYEGIGFETWLRDVPTVQWAWAIVILVMETIYLFATFSFGIRFSNLTNRGIFTNGPYRFSKHPAYVAKNISWWMTTVPFISHGDVAQTIKSSIALAGVSTVYFWRARTEERHLSRDPDYVAYATWMNEHGMLRFLNRIPGIRYVPPALPQPSTPPAALPASEREAESPAA